MSNDRLPLNVLYLTTLGPYAETTFALLAKAALLPEVQIHTTWDQLLAGVTHCKGDTLVVFDTWYLTKETISPEEITDMLCAVFRCTHSKASDRAARIHFALYSDTSCQADEVKSLKSSEILGIIPGPIHASLERRIEIVDTIAASKQCWPKEIIARSTKKPEADSGAIRLTSRQSQVLLLVCNRGLSNKKIASLLKISESTVKIHVSAILKEYGVRNRTQLALAARESLHA